jgi:hypothetical protein
MTIQELTNEELSELNPFNEFTLQQLYNIHKGIYFVKEDFFCNTNN